MKKANKIIIRKFIFEYGSPEKEILIDEKIKFQCPYCESGWVYKIKSKNQISCRNCGKKSSL